MIEAMTVVAVLLIFMISWNLWLEKLFFKFLEQLDEWKNGRSLGVAIDPHGSGPWIHSTLKNGKTIYFKGGKRTTKEEYYKIAGLYIESAIKGKDLSLSK